MSRTEAQRRADRAREQRGRPGWSGLLRLNQDDDQQLQSIMLPGETRQETLRRLIRGTTMSERTIKMADEQEEIYEAKDTHPETVNILISDLKAEAQQRANEIGMSVEIVCNDYVVEVIHPQPDEDADYDAA